jgi:hypothetical protein
MRELPEGRSRRNETTDGSEPMFEKILARNVHPFERILRALVGLVVLSLVFVGPKTAWGLVGLIPLLTAGVGSCPLYTLLGISTCKVKTSGKPQTQS